MNPFMPFIVGFWLICVGVMVLMTSGGNPFTKRYVWGQRLFGAGILTFAGWMALLLAGSVVMSS